MLIFAFWGDLWLVVCLWFNRLFSGFCVCSCIRLFCLSLLFVLRFGLCNNWLVSGLVEFVGFLLVVGFSFSYFDLV